MSMHADSPIDSLSSLIFIAFALGLDGFSVSLSIGLQKIRYRKMVLIGIVFRFSDCLIAFSGIVSGTVILIIQSAFTSVLASILLVLIGTDMSFSGRKDARRNPGSPRRPRKIVYEEVGVSLDSFR